MVGIVFVVLVGIGVAVRLALPRVVRWYVNRTLDQSQLYDGEIGDVSLSLWRGAYAIEDIKISKTTGEAKVPFFSAPRVEFTIEWPALWQGRLVGRVVMEQPEMNFVDVAGDAPDQTGVGAPWLQIIKELFPFEINSAEIDDGTIHFRAFHKDPPVDVYLSHVQGTVANLTNIHADLTPLFATVTATGLAMDHAQLELQTKLDPLAYRPTFQLALRLLGLDVTKTNSLARAYGDFDFEHGWLDLVVELDAKEGMVKGYVKPLFRDLQIFNPAKDGRGLNLLHLFWEALVGVAAEVLKNQPRDQVATVIPLSGDLSGPKTELLAVIGNLLRNAFVRAYLPRLQGRAVADPDLNFGPGSLLEAAGARPGEAKAGEPRPDGTKPGAAAPAAPRPDQAPPPAPRPGASK